MSEVSLLGKTRTSSNKSNSKTTTQKSSSKSDTALLKTDSISSLPPFEERQQRREEINEYYKSKLTECDNKTVPAVEYLETNIFPILNSSIKEMLIKAIDDDSLYTPKSVFNGIDYLSESLYNKNVTKHPERENHWTFVFDTIMAQKILKERPIYPKSRIWTKDFAALKIQSFLRGYWVRRQDEVQEMRIFWKKYKKPCAPDCMCPNTAHRFKSLATATDT